MTSSVALPVPPLRLRRVYLHGVGPDLARFDPLDLDFSTPSGAASRILLSLTNTGGKSTLITLISSLVVPAARAQVGGKNIGDYILTGDTAHIVCEWEDETTGLRMVTGTVMEWKDGRRQPAYNQRSTTNMHRAWYLFRTGPGLPGIDDLPFLIDDRRATFAAYLDELAELLGQHPESRWLHTRTQQEWSQALLDHTSIDPVLFGYQMRMNDSEAGAEALVDSFTSADNVVRFFVAALNNDRDIADFTSKLTDYAKLATERPKLLALSSFCTTIEPIIGRIAEQAVAAEEAAAATLRAATNGAEFAGAAHTRLSDDRALLKQQEHEVTEAGQAATIARRDYGQISDIRSQLILEDARAQLAAAVDEVSLRTAAARTARDEASAWEAVTSVLDIDVARTRRDAAQIAYDQADAGLGPLRDQVEAAAAKLAGRLNGLIKENLDVANAADTRASSAAADEAKARAAGKDAAIRCGNARRRIEEIDGLVRGAETVTRAARDAGWLLIEETPDQCLRRWQDLRGTAKIRVEDESAKAAAAEDARLTAETAKDSLDTELAGLRDHARDDRRQLQDFDEDILRVASQPGIEHLLGGSVHNATEIRRAQSLSDDAARDSDQRAAAHQSAADTAREELAHLDETGTAATGPDITAIVSALSEHRIGAVTGLQWIEHNIVDPEARRGFIADYPEIAGGVIVTDPARLAAADEYLASLKPRTRTPVTVVANPTHNIAGGAVNAARFVVVPHRATWDRQWAEQARVEYDETAQREGEAAARVRNDASLHRATAATCAAFVGRWADTRRDDLAHAALTSENLVATTGRERARLIAERDRQYRLAEVARGNAEAARKDVARADKHAGQADGLREKASAAEVAAQERPLVDAERRRAEEDEAAAEAAQDQALEARGAAVGEAAQARSDAATCRRELAALGVDSPAADAGGNLDVVRSHYESLRRELSTAEGGLHEADALDRAKTALSEAHGRAERYTPAIRERATELARLPAASSPESLAGAQRRSRSVAEAGQRDQLAAEHRKSVAEASLRSAQPAAGDRQNYVDLSNFVEWQPAAVEEIPALMERLDARGIELRDRRDSADQALRDAVELREELGADVDAFESIVRMWVGDPAPGQPAFSGPKRDAQSAMRELVEAQQIADKSERDTRGVLSDAVSAARAAANDPRWRDLEAHLVLRIRGLQESQLVAEAPLLSTRIRAVSASAGGDLDAMDTHRTILRDSLVAMCREQRRLLREVTASSRLSAGLGELTGQPAIKIRFEDAADDEVHARLGDRVDTWALELAANPKRAASAEVRARWLADATRDTVLDRSRAGAWSIDILKPRIDGQVMYCPPERIPHEFSGGQVLTLAVLVYCALSRVRSAHRTGGARPPGTLLLDNPFGAASAETLIQMQHGLAAHSGIQLICATGLNDANVEKAFTGTGSVIIKLRNDGDLRRNLSFLRLRARAVDGLDITTALMSSRPADATQNWVDSTRYEIR